MQTRTGYCLGSQKRRGQQLKIALMVILLRCAANLTKTIGKGAWHFLLFGSHFSIELWLRLSWLNNNKALLHTILKNQLICGASQHLSCYSSRTRLWFMQYPNFIEKYSRDRFPQKSWKQYRSSPPPKRTTNPTNPPTSLDESSPIWQAPSTLLSTHSIPVRRKCEITSIKQHRILSADLHRDPFSRANAGGLNRSTMSLWTILLKR